MCFWISLPRDPNRGGLGVVVAVLDSGAVSSVASVPHYHGRVTVHVRASKSVTSTILATFKNTFVRVASVPLFMSLVSFFNELFWQNKKVLAASYAFAKMLSTNN